MLTGRNGATSAKPRLIIPAPIIGVNMGRYDKTRFKPVMLTAEVHEALSQQRLAGETYSQTLARLLNKTTPIIGDSTKQRAQLQPIIGVKPQPHTQSTPIIGVPPKEFIQAYNNWKRYGSPKQQFIEQAQQQYTIDQIEQWMNQLE